MTNCAKWWTSESATTSAVITADSQTISKGNCDVFNSPKKPTKITALASKKWKNLKIQLYCYGASSRIGFVGFLGELKTPKRNFEINWPLVKSQFDAPPSSC